MDTNKIRYGFAFMLGAIAVGLNPSAMAADAGEAVTATATIDWSRLQLSVTGITGSSPNVLYENQHTSVNSNAWTTQQVKPIPKALVTGLTRHKPTRTQEHLRQRNCFHTGVLREGRIG